MNKAKAVWKIIASQIAAYIGGPATWLWSKILYYGGQALYDLAVNGFRIFKRSEHQIEKEKELDKVDKDPKSTSEDKGKAYEDYINTRN